GRGGTGGTRGRTESGPRRAGGSRSGGTGRLRMVRRYSDRGRRGDGCRRFPQAQGPVAEEADMNEVATKDPPSGTVAKAKSRAADEEIAKFFDRALRGDPTTIPVLKSLLDDGECGKPLADGIGSPAVWLRQNLISKASAKNALVQEAIGRKIDAVRA